MAEDGKVDWVITLGAVPLDPGSVQGPRTGGGSGEWGRGNTTNASLYIPGTRVRYASLWYLEGDECQLDATDENENDKEDRSAEVRYMCSPDSEAHLVVSEPAQCRYMVEMYLPGLCGVEGMQPEAGEAELEEEEGEGERGVGKEGDAEGDEEEDEYADVDEDGDNVQDEL
jgi:hypothetical protein